MEIILQMKINLVHIADTLHQQTHEVWHRLEAIFESKKATGRLSARLEEVVAWRFQALREQG
jgi:hypothetical protein